MKKLVIAATVAAGSLLALQASAFAQVGGTSFAFSGAETAAVNSPWTNNPSANWDRADQPAYYNYYVAPNAAPQARTVRRHAH